MRRFTRLALAALAAIGASGALVAAPAASWTNFADTTSEESVTGVRQYTLTSAGGLTITINGKPNADGSVTLGTSTAATNNTGIVLTELGALSGTKIVSVMLDVGNLPETTAELLAINLNATNAEVELKRVVAEDGTSTIQQQWADSNGTNGGWGNTAWTPANRQILTVTYSGDSNPQGTATYLNGFPLIANVGGLKTTGESNTISRIGIGENADAEDLVVYGLSIYTSKLSEVEVFIESAAANERSSKASASVTESANWSDLAWDSVPTSTTDAGVKAEAGVDATVTLASGDAARFLSKLGGGALTLGGGANAKTFINALTGIYVYGGTLRFPSTQESSFSGSVYVAESATLDVQSWHGLTTAVVALGTNATLTNGYSQTVYDDNKRQYPNLALMGTAAKISGYQYGTVASGHAINPLVLNGGTLTVEMETDTTPFYMANVVAKQSISENNTLAEGKAGIIQLAKGKLILSRTGAASNAVSLSRAALDLQSGTLELSTNNTTENKLGSLTGESAATLALGNKPLTIGALGETTTFAGRVTGSGTLTKVGTGEQTLSGTLSGFTGAYVIEAGKLILPTNGTLALANAISGAGTLVKSGTGALSLTGAVSTPVELAAGSLDLGTSRPAVTVTGEGTTLVLLQGLDDVADDVTLSPISLSFADGIASCTVVTKSLGGATKPLTISVNNVTEEGTVNVTFPTETGTVDDTLPTAHRTCGFENSSLTGLETGGMQEDMTFAASPFPGQGNYGQIESNGRPYSPDNNNNGFRTETGERGFTFSLKVCPNTCTNKGILFSFGKSANAVALLWQQDDPNSTTGRFAVYSVLSSGGASEPVVTSQLVTKAAWHAVSVVSSLETKRFYIIVDGKMAKSEVLSAGLSITNGVFQVGSVYANAPSEWEWNNGIGARVDDFRFDKVPLTQAQIARLLFHYAMVEDDSTLTGLKEFGSDTQVAWEALKATADARISVAEGVTATATLTTPVAAKLQVWGAGTLEVAKGESAQRIAAVELKEETTTLLLHRSQDEVVTSRVGTVGTFKFSGGTTGSPLMVNQTVRFPGAIAVAADSCINIYYTGSDNASYQVTGKGKNSTVILTSNHPWGVYNGDGAVTSFFRNLTLSLGGEENLWFRAGLTDNVWLDIQPPRIIHQEADWGNSVNGVLTVRNLTGGGEFNSKKASPQALCLLNTDETASEYTGETIFRSESNASMKLVFAGKWTVPNAMTTTNTPATVEIGDGSTATDVQLRATGNERALKVAANATLDVATGTPTAIDGNTARSFSDDLTLTNNGTLKLTSGYTYINVDGTGKTVVPAGSTFVFGIGGRNNSAPFTNDLTVEAEGDAKGELQLRTFNDATLTVRTLVLNGKLTKTEGRTPTIEVTGTGTLAAGSTLGAGVALTVAEEATCTFAGPTIDYHATTPLTVEGELSVTKTTTAYRQVVGAGKISVAEGKTLTIGRDGDTGKTGLIAGENGFTGTLEVASDATLALPNYASTAYTVENCDVTVNGMLSGGATLTLSAGKSLSGSGTINVPVVFAEVESATVSMASDTSLTFGSTLSVSKKVELAGAVTLANGAVLSGLGTLSGAVTCQSGATVEAGPTLSGSVTFADGVKLLAKLTDSSDVNNPIRYTLQCASTPTFEGTVKVSTPGYDLSVMKAPGLEIGKFSVDEASEKTDIQLRLIANEDASLTLMTFCKPVITGAPDDMTAEEKETLSERITNQFLEVMAQHNIVVSPVSASADPNKPNAKVEGVLLFEHVVKVGYVGDEETGYDPVALVSYDFGVADMTIRDLTLTGDTEATRYVVLCAKVSNGTASGDDAAAYGTKTTVSLLLGDKVCDGTEGNGPAATELTDDQLTAMNLTRGAGEKWFAVPMSTLGIGTHAFKVKAFKTTPAN